MLIPRKNGFPDRIERIARAVLIVYPFRQRKSFFDGVERLRVKPADLDMRFRDGTDPAHRLEKPHLIFQPVSQRGRNPTFTFAAVVKTRRTVAETVPAGAPVFPAVVIPAFLVFEHVCLHVQELMLLRLDGDPGILVAAVRIVMNRLRVAASPLCQLDCERLVAEDLGPAVF